LVSIDAEPRDDLLSVASSAGWELVLLPGKADLERLISLGADVVVVNLAVFGRDRWRFVTDFADGLPYVGLVVYSAASEREMVKGLRSGIDAWISRPCQSLELRARIEAVLRRCAPVASRNRGIAGLELRHHALDARVEGKDVGLNATEFHLLALLAASPGQAMTADELYLALNGQTRPKRSQGIKHLVSRLRAKLRAADPTVEYLKTTPGRGYQFERPPA
jgi:DNA-binding response OmpR family regulator